MPNQPFIITPKVGEPVFTKDSNHYDQTQENRIQILQAINGYLTINMLYESFKLAWSFLHYKIECPVYSYLSVGFLIINLLWGFCSYFGFRSISNKKPNHIRIFRFTVIGNFFLRIAMYVVCGVVMNGFVTSYIVLDQAEVSNLICAALYPQALYITIGVIQGLISLVILYLLHSVIQYIQEWDNSQTMNFVEMTSKEK